MFLFLHLLLLDHNYVNLKNLHFLELFLIFYLLDFLFIIPNIIISINYTERIGKYFDIYDHLAPYY